MTVLRNEFVFFATQIYVSPLMSILTTILQTSSPKYSPLRNFVSCEVALWWNMQPRLFILIEIKKAMMNI